MTTQTEALELALEALELNNREWKATADSGDSGYWLAEEQAFYQQAEKAITAIKEALTQPEQEPCLAPCGDIKCAVICKRHAEHQEQKPVAIPRFGLNPDNGMMYESKRGTWCLFKDIPPQRKPLTGDQRSEIAFRWRDGNGTASEIIDMVEAAHGIKE